MIVFTSTYGNGEAPTNSSKYKSKLSQISKNIFFYSILGFGSSSYPNFCAFAFQIEKELQAYPIAIESLELTTIDNKNNDEFEKWIKKWQLKENIYFKSPNIDSKPSFLEFKIISKSIENILNEKIFQLELQTRSKIIFRSGDLIAIQFSESKEERYYSIAKRNKNRILLTIKKHTNGKYSTFLSKTNINQKIKGKLLHKPSFNLPNKSKKVICIGNGTGIAPFLGIEFSQVKSIMFWGIQNKKTADELLKNTSKTHFFKLKIAYSQENQREYVHQLIEKNKNEISNHILSKNPIFICGSIKMRDDVLIELEKICTANQLENTNKLKYQGLILEDCY